MKAPDQFLKMHGAGNDFVIIDARSDGTAMTADWARAIGDRHRGVGFDQLAMLERAPDVAAKITFYNADGSTAEACGNATRCIARLLMDEEGARETILRTVRGDLPCYIDDEDTVWVNMGAPQLDWSDIPLAQNVDIKALPIDGSPSAVGMGNPHMVFAVDDISEVNVAADGAQLEHHPLYPNRTNVEFCQINSRNSVRMRVWERGAGITLACGSGACAAAVALNRLGLVDKTVSLELDGGILNIDWREDGVWMSGPTALVFSGRFDPALFA
jgi:diaminopimelate epimerase